MSPNPGPQPMRMRGFSLVEVLVALIIIAVGLLGIAKMDALVLSNAGISRQRALIALEAQSLAASMHADRDYWDSAPNNLQVTLTPNTSPYVQVANDGTLATAVSAAYAAMGSSMSINGALQSTGSSADSCELGGSLAPCSAVQMAAYDLTEWAQGGTGKVTSPIADTTTTVSCSSPSGVVACIIDVQWYENTVNATSVEQKAQALAQSTSGTSAFQKQTYELVVQP